jgi:hypothetical protein
VRGGVVLAALGVALSLVLVTRMNAREGATMAVTALLAAVHWWLVVRKEK